MTSEETSEPDFRDPVWIDSLKEQHPHDIAEQLRGMPILETRHALRQLPDELTAEVIAEFHLFPTQ